jgi:hypothetical protein
MKRWEATDVKGRTYWIECREDGLYHAGSNYRDGSIHQQCGWFPSYVWARRLLNAPKSMRLKLVK